jgi:deoxyadenosine/deoxycytidine kinase
MTRLIMRHREDEIPGVDRDYQERLISAYEMYYQSICPNRNILFITNEHDQDSKKYKNNIDEISSIIRTTTKTNKKSINKKLDINVIGC